MDSFGDASGLMTSIPTTDGICLLMLLDLSMPLYRLFLHSFKIFMPILSLRGPKSFNLTEPTAV